MKLKEVVENCIYRNSIIRLWSNNKEGCTLMYEDDSLMIDDVCMEWEILEDKVWQSKYKNSEVAGIKDIRVDTPVMTMYPEAINIVISKEDKWKG